MNQRLTMDEKIDQMMVDLASLKTDVSWLKRLFVGIPTVITVVGGIAVSSGAI